MTDLDEILADLERDIEDALGRLATVTPMMANPQDRNGRRVPDTGRAVLTIQVIDASETLPLESPAHRENGARTANQRMLLDVRNAALPYAIEIGDRVSIDEVAYRVQGVEPNGRTSSLILLQRLTA